jgi:hypothetical protein
MAINTFTTLKSAVADFLNRSDLTAPIENFIALAEAQINRDLRHWKMETRSSGQQSPSDEYMQLPNDWIETIRLHITDNGTSPLNLMSRASMADKRASNEDAIGVSTHYTHADGQIQLYPTPSATTNLELLYYAKPTALSASNSDNWLLLEAPDVYLYGSLLHSAPYLAEDERIAVWAQMYSAAITRLNEASEDAKYSGSGLTMKIRGLG